jgi:hypothetical protein
VNVEPIPNSLLNFIVPLINSIPFNNVQTQARPFNIHGIGSSKKAVEHVRLIFFGYADALINDGHFQAHYCLF